MNLFYIPVFPGPTALSWLLIDVGSVPMFWRICTHISWLFRLAIKGHGQITLEEKPLFNISRNYSVVNYTSQ